MTTNANIAPLRLFCLVEGDLLSEAFYVDANPTEPMYHLKRLVRAEMSPRLDYIAAAKLVLWRAVVPDDTRDRAITVGALNDKSEMSNPQICLSEFFPRSPDNDTYIIIQLPCQGGSVPVTRAPSGLLLETEIRKFNMRIEKIKETFFRPGAAIADFLHLFVKGEVTLPEADCCVRGLPKAWLRSSSFPTRASWPALYLLHPKRPHQSISTTPPSAAALERIDKFPHNDMITFCGVSGCGKTRAVVEMLAQRWGFYLNSSSNDRGSKDVASLFKFVTEMPQDFLSGDKKKNDRSVQALTCYLLISRLLVLQYCLRFYDQDKFTCDRWMLLQMCPGVFGCAERDIFDTIFTATLDDFYTRVPHLPLSSLEVALQSLFRQVRDALLRKAPDSSSRKFLVVLDNAQVLSERCRNFFVSHTNSGKWRPILCPIVHGLKSISKNTHDYCVVACGTGNIADKFDVQPGSSSIGSSKWQVSNRIIDFPSWNAVEEVEKYINDVGDLMSGDDKATLHTLFPEAAIRELFFRLRGRLRPIVSTIEEIILKGSATCWQETIEQNVRSLACYPERLPMHGNLCSNIIRAMDKVVLDPVESEHAIDLRRVLRQVFVFQLALGLPWSVPQEVPILSKSGLARLYSTTSQNGIWETVHTTIDEPLAFKAAINFIEEKDEEFYMLCWEQYRSSGFPPMGIEIFERHVPLDLVSAFHMQVFNQKAFSTPVPATSKTEHWILIPASEPVTFPLNLFDSPAEIVGWEDCRWGFEYKGTLTMRDFLEAHYKHDSRKGDEDVSPFFYPRLGSGPDIVFVVRVNEDLYPVFVKASLLQDLSPEDVEEYRLTLHESRIKEHLPELSEYCSRGKYFSLIYARCTISRTLQEDWSRDDLWDTAPATGPQVDRPLMQLLMVIDESNMRDIVPNGIVEMLNTMNGSKRMSDDPGSPDRSHKKFMWEKQ